MKRVMMFFLVFLVSLGIVSACTNYFDDGDDSINFGYIDVNGVFYADTCTSSTQLKEYYCNGASLASKTYSCGACNDGICYASTCDTANECSPIFRKWCDGSSWLDSGYCSDSNLGCYLKDSTCSTSTCTEGACDYSSHKYCSSNKWLSEDYCDLSHCGDDENSRGYCFCADTSIDSESNCTDDLDDDCDGNVDCNDSDCSGQEGCECEEGDTQICSIDEGACESGTQTCEGGSWSECSGIEASDELCDEEDNDCDGEVDEDCTCTPGDTRDCGADVGVCKAGVQVCQEDATWSLCFGASYAASEIEECNGSDDDCDGKVDEGCGCVTNTTQSCGSDVGSCQMGLQTCNNGSWNDCDGDIEAFPEICGDLLDNDCDDQIDSEDETCASSNITLNLDAENDEEEEREIAVGGECELDADCGEGSCIRGVCVDILEEKEEVESSSNSESVSSEKLSSLSSNNNIKEEKESSTVLYLVPILLIFFLLIGLGFWYVQKNKKKNPIVPEKKNTSAIVSSQPLKSVFPSFNANAIKEKKGVVDKALENSFKESSNLFKK